MEENICYYCGTKYSKDEACCPLCGQTETEADAIDEMPVELTAEPVQEIFAKAETQDPVIRRRKTSVKKKASKRNRSDKTSVLIFVLLGAAVIAGAIFILVSLGVFESKEKVVDNSSVSLPTEPVLCKEITLEPAFFAFETGVTSKKLSVVVSPDNCTEKVQFVSSDEAVAVVSDDGVITALSKGDADITATCGEQSATISISVLFDAGEPQPTEPDSVEQSETTSDGDYKFNTWAASTEFTLTANDNSYDLDVKGLSEEQTVTWSSSDSSVATVDEDGLVERLSVGKTTITATIDGSYTMECVVICN